MAIEKKKHRKQPHVPKMQPDKLAASGNRNFRIPLLIILFISFLAYFPIFQNGFVNLDDDKYILTNPMLNTINLADIFSSYVQGNYHPLTMLVYAIEYQFFGLNAGGYHTINLLLHLLNVILVFYAILYLSNRKEVALVASLLFGIHPLHVESVAWVSELKDLLYTFFFLASWFCYLKFLKDRKINFFIYCLLFFLLSLFSKAMAVSLPVVLVLTDYYKNRKLNIKVWLEKIPFFVLSILFGAIAIIAQKSSGAIQEISYYPFVQRIVFACYGFVTYLIKLVAPYELSAYYPYPVKSGDGIPGFYYIYPFLLMILIAGVIYSFRFSKKIFFGMIFFAITVFLVLQLLPVGNTIMADRYSYIPSIGIFFLAGEGFYMLWQKRKPVFNSRIPLFILLGIAIIFFSFTTYSRCGIWKNSLVLWNDVISKYKTIPIAYNNRGMVLEADNKIQEALDDYNKALALQPDFAIVYNNRGNILMNRQKNEEALRDYNKAIGLQPDMAQAYNGRGVLLMREKNFESAITNYNKAVELKPDYREAYYNKAICESNLGKKDDACRSLQSAMRLGMQQANDLYLQLCK